MRAHLAILFDECGCACGEPAQHKVVMSCQPVREHNGRTMVGQLSATMYLCEDCMAALRDMLRKRRNELSGDPT